MKNFGLSGKSVIITGASKGIGAAAALSFAAQGAKVALLARSGDAITSLAQEIGENALALQCDVSNFSQVQSAIGEAKRAFGSIDILVNNAGVIDPIGQFEDTTPEDWARTIDINLKGVMYCVRAAISDMIAQGGGTVITVSSGAAHSPIEGWTAYCTSKAGAYMLTRGLDLEFRHRGIRVLGLSPGTVATDMQKEIKASGINAVSKLEWSDHIPPEWPAKALMWMCTAEADDYLGDDVKLRDDTIRKSVGLV